MYISPSIITRYCPYDLSECIASLSSLWDHHTSVRPDSHDMGIIDPYAGGYETDNNLTKKEGEFLILSFLLLLDYFDL